MHFSIKTTIATVALSLITPTFAAKATNNSKSDASAEQTKIESIVRNYILNHPDIVIQAAQNFQKKQYELAQKTVQDTQKNISNYADRLFHNASDPFLGDSNAKITVTEFFDYQCPHCIDMAPIIASVAKANPNVRFVFKDFPIRGPLSELAARAAIAANIQNKYYALNHALLTLDKPLTEDLLYSSAQTVGIDVDKLKKDMTDDVVKNQLADNVKLAQDLKLFGTPALFIGKTDVKDSIVYIPGGMDATQLQTAIDKANGKITSNSTK